MWALLLILVCVAGSLVPHPLNGAWSNAVSPQRRPPAVRPGFALLSIHVGQDEQAFQPGLDTGRLGRVLLVAADEVAGRAVRIDRTNDAGSAAAEGREDEECRRFHLDIRDSVEDWTPFVPPKAPDGAPNVIYVVLDDVGFSAMSCYGGPIATPNIDKIAAGGVRYTQWHTTAL